MVRVVRPTGPFLNTISISIIYLFIFSCRVKPGLDLKRNWHWNGIFSSPFLKLTTLVSVVWGVLVQKGRSCITSDRDRRCLHRGNLLLVYTTSSSGSLLNHNGVEELSFVLGQDDLVVRDAIVREEIELIGWRGAGKVPKILYNLLWRQVSEMACGAVDLRMIGRKLGMKHLQEEKNTIRINHPSSVELFSHWFPYKLKAGIVRMYLLTNKIYIKYHH